MKKISYLIWILLIPIAAHLQPCKEVVGYYPNWQWYDRAKLVNPQTIDYSKYSVINYSFFAPQSDGTIKITDPWADKNLLLGPINWSVAPAGYDTAYDFGNPAYHHSGQRMADYCHDHDVVFLPSIGGWTLSDNFPAIAADPVKRQTFANQCVALIQAFGFDGIDLDWEYPGFADHSGTPQDEVNFTLLLQAVRHAIDVYGSSVNKDMMLTIAVSADPSKMDDVEWTNVAGIVDKINLMSYDFFGAFDGFTNHNSPLFAPAQGNPAFNAHSAIETLVNTYQVPREKINLGLAFYGRSQITASTPNLFQSSTGQADQVIFQVDEGTPMYYNYLIQANLFNEYWDDQAKVPYALGKNGLNTFLSFDNERSIAEKAKYIIDHDLGGAIIWEITGDYIETAPGSGVIARTPLVDTLNSVLCNYTGSGSTASVINPEVALISVFPNPSESHVTIENKQSQPIIIDLIRFDGSEVLRSISIESKSTQSIYFDLPSGVYLLKATLISGYQEFFRMVID